METSSEKLGKKSTPMTYCTDNVTIRIHIKLTSSVYTKVNAGGIV